MILLAEREGLINSDVKKTSLKEFMPVNAHLDTWKGIYTGDRWIGYIHTVLGPWESGYRINSKSHLRFKMFNQMKNLSIISVQNLNSDYHLIDFETRISGVAGITLKGKRLENKLIVEIIYGETTNTKSFEMGDNLFLDQSILQVYRGKDLKVGDSYTLSILNPLTLNMERIEAEVIENQEGTLVMETRIAGLISRSWINQDGLVVREEMPNGWLIKMEDKQTIEKHLSGSGEDALDILKDVSVRSTKKLRNPRDVYFMTIRVTGIDLEKFSFEGKRQKIIDSDEGIIEISSIFQPVEDAMELPCEEESLGKFLTPSTWIDFDDPAIRAKTSEIVSNEKNSWLAAKKIGKWVHKNIEKSFTPDVPVATTILKDRKGDCNEHTVLFIAMARAYGIPAEMCAGLVYLNGGFYYHAWPKVYVGRWVHLDPTLGQDIADATHFELVSGDLSAQLKIALAIGNINIEILKAPGLRS